MQKNIFNPESLIRDFKRNNIPFVIEKTLFTKKIISKYGTHRWNAKTELTFRDLLFIKKVKDYANQLNNIPKKIDRKKIYYVNRNTERIEKLNVLKRDLFEIDLTGAYWELAFRFEYISETLYNEGLQVDKKVRLIALGNLAKRTAVLEYTGSEFLPIHYLKSEQTENIFFDVAQHTDYIMRRLAILAGDEYLFYWVDGIFIKGQKTVEIISEFLDSNEIKFKIVHLQVIKFIKNNLIKVQHLKNEKEKKRIFNFS